MRLPCTPTLLVVLCLASPASAATLDQIDGLISINRGEGFLSIAETTQARTGDLISAGPSGTARLTYDDGCVVRIRPNTVVRVRSPSPCKAGYLLNDPFLSQLGPFALGGAAVFAAFCISACDDDGPNGRTSVSP